ncbi:hypothetical protein BAUCODRAFT_29501 [Baudoinia panamericana UAMH 10762]|uniref:Uncharacterized protein n=1 Tax=Baudoinia panamericana (strain UAMH 10762) TaxID=717646 RepID=M2M205_BAUPA|nr:uncharacterized protein BAUCODRAFT_29501 [Baudoinia panamericana UAMH 10762]EMD01108.1 hypothetical protein BAUCODRAFT_29501 [Baudoinia panamericana UAMH 10762]
MTSSDHPTVHLTQAARGAVCSMRDVYGSVGEWVPVCSKATKHGELTASHCRTEVGLPDSNSPYEAGDGPQCGVCE